MTFREYAVQLPGGGAGSGLREFKACQVGLGLFCVCFASEPLFERNTQAAVAGGARVFKMD